MSNAGLSEVDAMTITFKYAMTVEGTRMFRGIVDEQVSIRPEWMFDPFQDALPCWDASMAIQRRLIDWENMGKLKGQRNPLECL